MLILNSVAQYQGECNIPQSCWYVFDKTNQVCDDQFAKLFERNWSEEGCLTKIWMATQTFRNWTFYWGTSEVCVSFVFIDFNVFNQSEQLYFDWEHKLDK